MLGCHSSTEPCSSIREGWLKLFCAWEKRTPSVCSNLFPVRVLQILIHSKSLSQRIKSHNQVLLHNNAYNTAWIIPLIFEKGSFVKQTIMRRGVLWNAAPCSGCRAKAERFKPSFGSEMRTAGLTSSSQCQPERSRAWPWNKGTFDMGTQGPSESLQGTHKEKGELCCVGVVSPPPQESLKCKKPTQVPSYGQTHSPRKPCSAHAALHLPNQKGMNNITWREKT